MSWIEYHQDLWNLWKIERLAAKLGVTYAHALGLISCLWTWAISNARDGSLKDFTDDEIASACRWTGNHAGNIRKLLIECELVDGDTGRIHDWESHGLRLLNRARERTREWREKKKKSARTAKQHS